MILEYRKKYKVLIPLKLMTNLYNCPCHYNDAKEVEITVNGKKFNTCSGSKDFLAKLIDCVHCQHRDIIRKASLEQTAEIEELAVANKI